MKLIYPQKLEELVKDNKYIIRKLAPGEKLKRYHRYWCTYSESFFKVIDIYNIDEYEYYTIKYQNTLYGEITYPDNEIIYELLIDYHNIASINDIVNNRISYTGAEIKHWFVMNQDKLLSEKYENFYPFLTVFSKSQISDDKSYFLYADKSDNVYKDCKVSLDKIKEKKKGD